MAFFPHSPFPHLVCPQGCSPLSPATRNKPRASCPPGQRGDPSLPVPFRTKNGPGASPGAGRSPPRHYTPRDALRPGRIQGEGKGAVEPSPEIKKRCFSKARGLTEQGWKRAPASVPVPPAVPSGEPRRRHGGGSRRRARSRGSRLTSVIK